MPARPLRIWCNLALDDRSRHRLESGTSGHQLLWAAELTKMGTGAPDPQLAQAAVEVVFGQPEASQCAALLDRPDAALHWIHLSSAGYTSFDDERMRGLLRARDVALTTSSAVYAEPCAQHVLAFMLAAGRQLPAALRNQQQPRAWPKTGLRAASVLLRRQRVLLVGYGAIGRRLSELLVPFDVVVEAVRRSPRGDEPVPTYPHSELDRLLGAADHVVDLLPGNGSTTRLFDAGRFAACKRGAVFYNIGRGTTVDQPALRAALAGGRLSAAYLDVTDPEPLPPDDPLWTTAGCFISPHTAGGHADESDRLVEHFLANLDRYQQGLPLADRVV